MFIVAGILLLAAAIVNAFRLRERLAVMCGLAAVGCFILASTSVSTWVSHLISGN